MLYRFKNYETGTSSDLINERNIFFYHDPLKRTNYFDLNSNNSNSIIIIIIQILLIQILNNKFENTNHSFGNRHTNF